MTAGAAPGGLLGFGPLGAVPLGTAPVPPIAPARSPRGLVAYLVEIAAYDSTSNTPTSLLFSASPRGGYNDPSAPGYYDPRLMVVPTFRRDMFSAGTTGGQTSVSYGDLVLANADGGLDGLRDLGLAGQSCVVLIGDPDDLYQNFSRLIYARIEQGLFDLKEVHIRLRDRLLDLQVVMNQTLYLGNNALPNGLEGAADLLGKPKPMVFGSVSNVSPPLVNTSRLIYQVNNGAVADIPAVYDAGAALSRGADYTSQSDMESNAPAAGFYRAWLAGGYFRLGQTARGTLTADVLEGATAAFRTPAQIAKRIVTGANGIASTDVAGGDVGGLDLLASGVVGIWIAEQAVTFAAALDQVLQSVGAWYGFDRTGQFRMQQLVSPS